MANINEVLWSRLFLDNRDSLVAELDELMTHLTEIRNAVAASEEDKLRALLREAGEIKREVG